MEKEGWGESRSITPDEYKACVFKTQKKIADVGFISNIIENHDEPRGVSRYIPEGDQSPMSKKMLATVYFLVKGLPWIYQGQELGMENIPFNDINEVDDIATIDEYNVAVAAGIDPKLALSFVAKYSRDNARTPFQWSSGANAGFTTGTPWLRINPNYTDINYEDQKDDPDSVFNYYRALTGLRKNSAYSDVLVWGELVPWLEDWHNVMSYKRELDGVRILIIANYQNKQQTLPLPGKIKEVLLSNDDIVYMDDDSIILEGYQAAVIALHS